MERQRQLEVSVDEASQPPFITLRALLPPATLRACLLQATLSPQL